MRFTVHMQMSYLHNLNSQVAVQRPRHDFFVAFLEKGAAIDERAYTHFKSIPCHLFLQSEKVYGLWYFVVAWLCKENSPTNYYHRDYCCM